MRHLSLLSAALCLVGTLAADDRTMSFNHTVHVVPAPGPVVIDGHDDDWDLSAGVWSYNDPTVVERYSLWTHLMYDDQGVYFLARYHDPSPRKNAAAGKDFSVSWRADCFQARVVFDDREDDEHQMHVNMYHSSTDAQDFMIIHHGGFRAKPPYDQTGPQRPDQLERWGPTMDSHGGAMVTADWADGQGYNLEAFWPWAYCRTDGEPLQAGDQFTFGIEAMWGNRDGTELAHRLADGIRDEAVNRIFMFRARDGWGRAVIEAEGGKTISEDQRALHAVRLKRFVDYDTYGSIPISYELPAERDVTIAIEDAEGRRVRNLFGQYPKPAGSVTDRWDGLDDAGNPVSPGSYTARILHHEPIGLEFVNSAYSSSIPPWATEAGKKLWGSNHGHPTSVATRGETTVLTFTGTEGGSGIQLIDADGVIQWCDLQEFVDCALDDDYAYGLSKSSWQQKSLLFRYRLTDGQMTPFDDADRTPSPALLPDRDIATTSSLALAGGKLWACFPGRALQRIDPATGAIELEQPAGELIAVADRADVLYALATGGRIVVLDGQGEIAETVATVAELDDPVRLAVDQVGERFLISDHGSNQVVLVDRVGAQLHRFGSAYAGDERPAGTFVTTDLIKPMGTGFDAQGRIWIPEGRQSCKRVGLWSAEGELLDAFWGQADYGAMQGWPIISDSSRYICHGIEFALDPDPRPYERKTNEQPLLFHPELIGKRGIVRTFEGHDFAVTVPGFNQGRDVWIYRRDERGVFVPCVHIQKAGRKGQDAGPRTAWVDRDGDGQRDADELTADIGWPTMYWSNGWVRENMDLYTVDNRLYPLQGINQHGVPEYDFSAPRQVAGPNFRTGNYDSTPVIDRAGTVSSGIRWRTADGRTGTYPNPYGRHDAPAARRGLLIAPFRTNGVVEDVPGVGSITAIGGDRGEWFVMSMDGMYISNICQDIKGTVVLDETRIGGESFGGHLWRDEASGRVLVQLGGASYRIMELTGLESCVLELQQLEVTEAQIQEGMQIAQERQQQAGSEAERLRIAKVRNAPSEAPPVMQPSSKPLIDGAVDVQVAAEGDPGTWWRAAMAIHGKDLVVAWQVADPSPWMNGSSQYTHAFIGGDGVDLQLDVPGRGPIRVLVAKVAGKPTAVYSQAQPVDGVEPVTYAVQNNLTNATTLGQVKRLESAEVDVQVGFNSYTVLLRVPLAQLGLDQALGQEISGVVGAIYSDPTGTDRTLRLYWHDKQTGMVNDVPTEARLTTRRWGPIDVDR